MFVRRNLKWLPMYGWFGAAVLALTPGLASAGPTCSDLGIANHGQHIVGDYVTGLGALIFGTGLDWPPNGEVGGAVSDNGGAYLPGGPGPGYHFDEGAPPGASFCLPQAHPNGFDVPDTGPH